MRAIWRLGTLPLLAGLLTGTSSAQETQPTPRVEAGAALGGILTGFIDVEGAGLGSGMAGLRVSAPIRSRFATEGGLAVGPGGQACCYRQFEGLYTVQVRQRLTHDRGSGPFLTYGAAGYIARAFRHTIVEPPFFAAVGGGFDHPLGRRATVRIDAQALSFFYLPLGVRASAGVSFAFGGR